MEKKGRKIDKKAFIEWFLVIITGIIINFLCVLIFSFTSNASGEVELPEYPFIIDFGQNPTELSLEDIQSGFSIGFGNLPQDYVLYCASVDQGYFNGPHGWDYYDFYTYVVSVNPIFEYPLTLDVNSSSYYITNSTEYRFDYYTHSGTWGSFATYSNIRHQYAYYYMAQGLGYILYGTEEEYYSTDDILVWEYEHAAPIETGHATHPHFDGLHPHYGNTVTPPSDVPPTYTVNNYSWTTYNNPPIDNSSTNALLESIFDILSYNAGYLQTNISNEFDNLILNIKGLVDYLGQTLQYYGDLIIANIQNGIQNFYDNMVSLIEPIYDKISALQEKLEEFADLIINPFDEEEFDEQIENSSFFTNYNAIIENCDEISEIFDYAEERDHFSLYISFENPFADSEHKIIASEINFDWLVPLRSVYRPFIWACVLVELFIGGAKVLTRIIGGHGLGQ